MLEGFLESRKEKRRGVKILTQKTMYNKL